MVRVIDLSAISLQYIWRTTFTLSYESILNIYHLENLHARHFSFSLSLIFLFIFFDPVSQRTPLLLIMSSLNDKKLLVYILPKDKEEFLMNLSEK